MFSAEDLYLDRAGAILCEPGCAEETAIAVAESLTEISADSLRRTKRELYN